MNNKKSIYILLPAAILLWVYIGWQIYQQVKEPAPVESIFTPTLKRVEKKEKPIPFVLALNYKDPFLRSVNGKHSNSEELERKKGKSVKKNNRRRIAWPNLTYRGWIENHKKTIGLLQINNKQYLVDEGLEYNGILIEKLYQDSIRIKKDNEVKRIVKTK